MTAPVRFFPAELGVLRRRPFMSTFDWTKANFRLVAGPSEGKFWDPNVIPYARGIMDWCDRPFVREVIIAAPSQTTKSTIGHACLFAAMWRNPGPAALALPDEKSVERVFEDRVHKLFQASPELRRMLLRDRSALQKTEVKLASGHSLHAIWAGSEASKSSISVEYLMIDEEDAYADKGSVAVIKERVAFYPTTSKIIRVSKPRGVEESSVIWQGLREADAVFKFEAACPACGVLQVMDFARIRVPEGERDPQRILSGLLARYYCEGCGYGWSDHVRDKAVRRGRWVTDSTASRPASVAFHLPSWYSPRISLSKVMADFFKAQRAGEKGWTWFDNSHKAVPHRVVSLETTEDRVRRMIREDVPARLVPAEALALTCGVDVQKDGFWFVVRAWARSGESWLVEYGWLNSFADLARQLFETAYPVAGLEGVQAPIWRAAVDLGGSRFGEAMISRTTEVKQWLQANGLRGQVYGTKGASRALGMAVRPSRVGVNPDAPAKYRAAGGQITIYLVDTVPLKDLLHYRLQPDCGSPAWLHAETGPDYVRHMTAEKRHVDAKSGAVSWQCPSGAPNHLWDAEVLAAACADPVWTPALGLLPEPVWTAPLLEEDVFAFAEPQPRRMERW